MSAVANRLNLFMYNHIYLLNKISAQTLAVQIFDNYFTPCFRLSSVCMANSELLWAVCFVKYMSEKHWNSWKIPLHWLRVLVAQRCPTNLWSTNQEDNDIYKTGSIWVPPIKIPLLSGAGSHHQKQHARCFLLGGNNCNEQKGNYWEKLADMVLKIRKMGLSLLLGRGFWSHLLVPCSFSGVQSKEKCLQVLRDPIFPLAMISCVVCTGTNLQEAGSGLWALADLCWARGNDSMKLTWNLNLDVKEIYIKNKLVKDNQCEWM